MQPFEDPSDPSVQHASNPFAAPAPVEIDTSVPMDNRPFHPVSSIWLHPRITIRQILDRDPNLYVILLVCISGIGESLDRASLRNMGDQVPLVAILVLACLLGPIGGLIQLYIGSWLLRWTGSWIGGTAPSSHLRTAIAWSSVPAIAAMVFGFLNW